MHERYAQHLRASGVPWAEVRGTHDERLRTAVESIDPLL
jgi:hypothetical protein